MKALFIINDPLYGTKRVYNALRLAHALLTKEPLDSVIAAKAGQKTPDGYYNVERMLKRVLTGLCGACRDARGLDHAPLMAGPRRRTMDKLAAATAEADKVLVF